MFPLRLVVAAGTLCLCAQSALQGQTTQSPQELLKEAVTFHQQGKLEEAIHDYELFLDLYPDAPEVRSNLGAALAATGKYVQAIEQYKLALMKKSDPKLQLNLALAYYKTDDFGDAIVELEKVHESDRDNQKVLTLLADCYVHTGENKKAIDLLLPVFNAGTNDVAIEYVLGTALARDGQAELAQRVINPLMEGPDSAEKHMLLGTAKFAARDYPGALEEIRKAAEMNPNLPEVNSYYGQALFSNGRTEESKALFEKELTQNPNDFQSNVHLGLLLKQDQKYDEALKFLKRAQASHPGDVAVRLQIALVKMAQGKDQVALDELEDIVFTSPKFLEAHVSLSTLYYRLKRKEDGNREREIVQRLTAERQAEQPAARLGADGAAPSPTTKQ
ncbi:MAG TPA: tetratricopeptide repeat protein [Bryobacteraceae bacterium]|nr:tetratricopeptide repeat protein [Bryobacteraceae bacterium]